LRPEAFRHLLYPIVLERRRADMDFLTPLQTGVLIAVLDAGIAIVRMCRARRRERRVLRLVRGSAVASRSRTRPRRPVIAILASRPAMQVRARDALRDLPYDLRYPSTWDELRRVVLRTSPAAVLADPLADRDGSPGRHLGAYLLMLHVPVILYTRMTVDTAKSLVQLGQCPFRHVVHVVVHQVDDSPERLAAVVAALPKLPSAL
jgi:hypothetical protein